MPINDVLPRLPPNVPTGARLAYTIMPHSASTEIIDIRTGPTEFDILQDIRKGLRPENGGEKTLPTLLLYDEAGLKLFEKITYLEQYYLTNAEIEVLETYADRIADYVRPGSIVVELGSGNLRKVNILLQAIERQGKDVEYYALDLSLRELQRTFSQIPTTGYKHVKCFGLYGTYDQGMEWLKSPQVSEKPKTILWLGSSLGNFKREEVAPFLQGYEAALQPGDTILIGIDSCKDPNRVFHAYNDRDGVTHDFTLNGLRHANHVMGEDAFQLEDWQAIGEYDVKAGRHHAFVSPLKDVEVDGVTIPHGERIRIEESYKYSREEIERLWKESGFHENTVFPNARGDYGLHLVAKPKVTFPLEPTEYASHPVPTFSDFQQLWTAWDAVTVDMIPKEKLLSKPIRLRNPCIFYLGHIPTFLDIHITRVTGEAPIEPATYRTIFERGIDPDVENPERCHPHSEIPEEWPPVEDILAFQRSVRERVERLYTNELVSSSPQIGRALWLGLEHEAMHLETVLYMLIQSEQINPPPATVKPVFAAISHQFKAKSVPNEWFTVPESDITVGLNDLENDSGPSRYFGWDNEKPQRSVHVKAFSAKGRAITNGEYAEYLQKTGNTTLPASWCETPYKPAEANGAKKNYANGISNGVNGSVDTATDGKFVRTVFGAVPLKDALEWPVIASYDELNGCAQWMGGRIPTADEVRSIYNYVDRTNVKEFHKALGKTIPAVNSHLINDGVQESPPSKPFSNGVSSANTSPYPHDLFVSLEGVNVGFQHWHPVPVTHLGNKLNGRSGMGGVWEWTSTVLEKHEGFEAMPLYPAYTADFFDGKHNITLGGSWASHPRIAGRKSFVNWYQRTYPYTWAGARVVRDI